MYMHCTCSNNNHFHKLLMDQAVQWKVVTLFYFLLCLISNMKHLTTRDLSYIWSWTNTMLLLFNVWNSSGVKMRQGKWEKSELMRGQSKKLTKQHGLAQEVQYRHKICCYSKSPCHSTGCVCLFPAETSGLKQRQTRLCTKLQMP